MRITAWSRRSCGYRRDTAHGKHGVECTYEDLREQRIARASSTSLARVFSEEHTEDSDSGLPFMRMDQRQGQALPESRIGLYSKAITKDSTNGLDFMRRNQRFAHDLYFVNGYSAVFQHREVIEHG